MLCMENYLKWDGLPKQTAILRHLVWTIQNMYDEIKKMIKACTVKGKKLKHKLIKLSSEDSYLFKVRLVV